MNVGLQLEIIKAALTKLTSHGHFNICVIDDILKLTGGIPDKKEYDALHALHCVNYSSMSPRLRLELPRMIQRVLESQPMNFDCVLPALLSPERKLIG